MTYFSLVGKVERNSDKLNIIVSIFKVKVIE